jgi:hypothetical protein
MKEQVYTGFAVRDITEEKKLRDWTKQASEAQDQSWKLI